MQVLNNMTAEAMDEKAREMSRGGYAAIVEIVHYMQSESFLTIASGRSPIVSHSRGGEARFVLRQWKDGNPLVDPKAKKPGRPLVNIGAYDAPDGLPF